MATILAHNLPPPPVATQSTIGPPLLLQLHQQPTVIVNSHPTALHFFTNNSLQSAWSFPHPIVSYSCSYYSSSSNDTTKQEKENNGVTILLLVATQDGSIWNVPLSSSSLPVTTTTNNNNTSLNPGGGGTNQTTNKSIAGIHAKTPSSPEIAIKIEDDDRSKADEEEVELWNDEDGLVVDQDFDALDSLLPPASKRQRTASPPPATVVTTTTTFHGAIELGRRVQAVNKAQHLVGFETNISHIAVFAGNLLIFRHGECLQHWTSRHQFAPHTEIIRQSIPTKTKADKLQAVVRISECPLFRSRDRRRENALFVATKSSVIYRISISESMVDVQELFKVKESVASLLTIPNKSPSQGQSLVVVGKKGTVSWSKITQPNQEGRFVASTPKIFSFNQDVQSAFAVEGHLYVLSGTGRVLRLLLASLESTDNKDLEIMDLPPLCALSPALSHSSTTIEGLYGLNQRGQLLRFPADWIKHARPQEVANARDTVGGALSELERLSDQVKQLEIQCQMENQRIVTYNRLVFELQRSVLASSRQQDVGNSSTSGGGEDVEMGMEMQMEPGLLIDTSLSTFAHVVSDGYDGTKRFYARLRIKSRANIDWSHGWSVGVNMASKVEFCSHGKPTTNASSQHHPDSRRKTRMHHQTFASLRTLTRQTPWTLDIELDREMIHFLPLQVSIGLLFRELGSNGGNSGSVGNFKADKEGFAAYFVVDCVDLDVLDFVEGVEDPLKCDVPAFVQQQLPRPTTTTSHSNNNIDKKEDEEECHQCRDVGKGNSSDTNTGTSIETGTGGIDAASLFRPIEFEIDTTSILIPQCLSALLFLESDNNNHYKAVKVIDMMAAGRRQGIGMGMEAMVEACFRTCFILPDECLSSRSASLIRPMLNMSATQMQGHGHRNNLGMDAMAARSLSGSRNWGGGVVVGAEVAGGRQIENPDLKMVWVDLEVPATGAGSGGSYDRQPQQQNHAQGREGVVRAHVLVRGSDLERVHVVRQALEKRIRALFD